MASYELWLQNAEFMNTKQVIPTVCTLIKLFGGCGCPGGHEALF
jgi:hypothetical protein